MELKFIKFVHILFFFTVLISSKVNGQSSVCFDGGSDAAYTVGTAPQFVAVGDLNRDGKSDAVVVNKTTIHQWTIIGP